MGELSKLPNIGKVVEEQLIHVGIETPEQLKQEGSKEAWSRILEMDDSACINRLYGLEGAIQGIRWHDLDPKVKEELHAFYDSKKK